MKGKKIIGIIFLFSILIIGTVSSLGASIRPPLILDGYVKESGSGTPIEGATVELWVYDFITDWKYIGSDTTDTSGHYSFLNLPIGAIKIRVAKSGYSTYEGVFQQTIFLAVFTYDYIFYGHIRDSTTSQELSDAIVEITCGSKIITDTTDNSGYYCIKFSFSTSGIRTFSLVANREGYRTKTNIINRNYGYELQHYYLGACWALIVAGETDERFTRDALGMYNTLIDYYGFTDDRIYLITPLDSIDGCSVPRDRNTNRANVQWGTDQIESYAGSDDLVVIWWSGHGRVDYFCTDSNGITARQLDNYLDDIICDKMYIFLGPCHSGSFINNLDDEQNRAIYTSCKEDQNGYVSYGGGHSYFSWATYLGLNPNLNAVFADTNSDNKISLFELFNYCVNFVDTYTSNQDPQRWVGSTFGNDADAYFGDEYYN